MLVDDVEVETTLAPGWLEIDLPTSRLVDTHMLVGENWVPRPVCPQPMAVTPGVWQINDVPEGCCAEIYDEEFAAFMGRADAIGGTITIELPDPGMYKVEISAPSPWLRAVARLETPA